MGVLPGTLEAPNLLACLILLAAMLAGARGRAFLG